MSSMEPVLLLSSISSIVHSTQLFLESNLQSPLHELTVGALYTPAQPPHNHAELIACSNTATEPPGVTEKCTRSCSQAMAVKGDVAETKRM